LRKCLDSGMTYPAWFSHLAVDSSYPNVVRPTWEIARRSVDQGLNLSAGSRIFDSRCLGPNRGRFEPLLVFLCDYFGF
jgi:hypothetical protein